jgi:alpha-1,6-rhamnosyltransferase
MGIDMLGPNGGWSGRFLGRLRWLRALPGRVRAKLRRWRHIDYDLSYIVSELARLRALREEEWNSLTAGLKRRADLDARGLADAFEGLRRGELARLLEGVESLCREAVPRLGETVRDLHRASLDGVGERVQRLLAVEAERAGDAMHVLRQCEIARIIDAVETLQGDAVPKLAALVRQDVARVAEISRQSVHQLAESLEQFRGAVQEQFLLLEHSIRQRRQAAAHLAMGARYPPVQQRGLGLSILVPCWNQGSLLERAVASALAALDALEAAGEVIVMDDASRDRTRAVAGRLVQADSRIRLVTTEENLGLARARNVLLGQARFQHAVLLDADNRLVPAGVRVLYQAARETNAILSYGVLVVKDACGGVVRVINCDRMTRAILDDNQVDALAMVRTEPLLDLGGYDPESRIEDWELDVRLMHLGEPVCFVPTVVGYYRLSSIGMNHDSTCISARRRRVQRIYAAGGGDLAEVACLSTYHPATGYLWRSTAWKPDEAAPDRAALRAAAPTGPRILVVSSGGVGNLGDDAILLSTLQRLQRVRPGCMPVVVTDGKEVPPLGRLGVWAGTVEELCRSLDPDRVRSACRQNEVEETLAARVGAAGSAAPFAPVDLSGVEVVLVTGGGNLNCYWPDLAYRRAAIVAAAAAHGIPCIVSGQGIGPLSPEVGPALALLAGVANRFGVRDPLSADLVRDLPRPGWRADVVGCDALGLDASGARDSDFRRPLEACGLEGAGGAGWRNRRLEDAGVPRGVPLVAFQAREHHDYVGLSREALLDRARQVDDFALESGGAVVGVPLNTQAAVAEIETLSWLMHALPGRGAPWFLVDCGSNVRAVAQVLRCCQAAIVQSYHAALFALEYRVPTLMYFATEYYRLKAVGLREYFGIPVEIVLPAEADAAAAALQIQRIRKAEWMPVGSPGKIDCWLDEALAACCSRKLAGCAA